MRISRSRNKRSVISVLYIEFRETHLKELQSIVQLITVGGLPEFVETKFRGKMLLNLVFFPWLLIGGWRACYPLAVARLLAPIVSFRAKPCIDARFLSLRNVAVLSTNIRVVRLCNRLVQLSHVAGCLYFHFFAVALVTVWTSWIVKSSGLPCTISELPVKSIEVILKGKRARAVVSPHAKVPRLQLLTKISTATSRTRTNQAPFCLANKVIENLRYQPFNLHKLRAYPFSGSVHTYWYNKQHNSTFAI